MSSPYSNLSKLRKNLLTPGTGAGGRRPAPFRSPDITDIIRSQIEIEDEDRQLLDEVTAEMADKSRTVRRLATDPVSGGRRKQLQSSTSKPPTRQNSDIPTDMDLMSSMMSRIAQLELKIQFQDKEIHDKDRKIKAAEDKMKILIRERESDGGEIEHIQELEKERHRLQKQVQDMEIFLADYGMVWVGEDSDKNDSDSDQEELWRPGTSLPQDDEFNVDYDLVIENIKDLNVLAGDGESKIQHTTDGARLKATDPISLILYANGILMFNGPFRPFTDPFTYQCIKDLQDGYFPSELQTLYPDGIPFKVTDLRNVHFKDKRGVDVFCGEGQILGGKTQPSNLIPTNLKDSKSEIETTSTLPARLLSREQFLTKLPSSVIKNGKIIDIRGSISNTLSGGPDAPGSVKLLQTKAVVDMKQRLNVNEDDRPVSARDVTTLRIKSETGDETFVLKMKFHETIQDIRNYIDNNRADDCSSYDIVSSFPKRVFTDNEETLLCAGLTPSATLHLKRK
ncbi:UBX domain-containing protein 11-like [Tubulanus polymorphus]|uniref:UBX domain-containing protein 11-like n=1 Tax=Tubulanus polymorphus TaxID=672921 RepID=UPI003DA441B6